MIAGGCSAGGMVAAGGATGGAVGGGTGAFCLGMTGVITGRGVLRITGSVVAPASAGAGTLRSLSILRWRCSNSCAFARASICRFNSADLLASIAAAASTLVVGEAVTDRCRCRRNCHCRRKRRRGDRDRRSERWGCCCGRSGRDWRRRGNRSRGRCGCYDWCRARRRSGSACGHRRRRRHPNRGRATWHSCRGWSWCNRTRRRDGRGGGHRWRGRYHGGNRSCRVGRGNGDARRWRGGGSGREHGWFLKSLRRGVRRWRRFRFHFGTRPFRLGLISVVRPIAFHLHLPDRLTDVAGPLHGARSEPRRHHGDGPTAHDCLR